MNFVLDSWHWNILKMHFIKTFTECFSRKIVRRFMVLYQFVLITLLFIFINIHFNNFSNAFILFCMLYIVFNLWCAVVEMDSAMTSPNQSRDLTTILVVWIMQFILAIWCISLFFFLFLMEDMTKFRDHYTNDVQFVDSKSAEYIAGLVFIADFFNQIMWALYLFVRFFRDFFPRGEETVIFQHGEEYTIYLEDPDDETPKDAEVWRTARINKIAIMISNHQ